MQEGTEKWLSALRTVGSTVSFGHYEQDNDLENGKETIEWIVLDVEDGRSLLLSKMGLDSQPIDTSKKNVTWAGCSLANWLNHDFLENAFSEKERMSLYVTDVDNSDAQHYTTNNRKDNSGYGGINTEETVFLLSFHEVEKYFPDYKDRKCVPTEYAVSHGANMGHNNFSWWWLRSPVSSRESFLCVGTSGAMGEANADLVQVITDSAGVVRPAIWIDNAGLKTFGYTFGYSVTFGHYEQDNDLENGPEPLEWVVLDANNGQSLLISKYALDWRPFHEPSSNVPWESSLLRRWLNGDFVKAAFTDSERKAIATTIVENRSRISSQEQVFLLSLTEAQKYYPEEMQRVCEPTLYALRQGTFTADNGYCAWWLRSSGSGTAQYILNNGTRGDYIAQKELAVRPVLWVNQEALKQVFEQEKILKGLQNADTVGETVTFGRYEQKAPEEAGMDPIEWLVLDTQGNKSLLISKYVLDGKAFDESGNHTTWDNSSLRTWLNQTFLEEAFSPLEKKHIVNTYVDNSSSQGYRGYHSYAGSSTYDYVFLLSYAEADKYFRSDEERIAAATEYAGSTEAVRNRDHCKWWLRSPGSLSSYTKKNELCVVNSDGVLGYCVISTSKKGVRPAIWITTG